MLRGVNVGGNNKVEMKQLASAFEEAGMTAVRTYINSGNVIFSTEQTDRGKLTKRLEAECDKRFGFPFSMVVLDLDQMRAIVESTPSDWANNETMRCDVMFLRDEEAGAWILDEVPFNREIEDVLCPPGAIVRRVDRKDQSRSGLLKVLGTPAYQQITIRNCNTARKLLDLMQE